MLVFCLERSRDTGLCQNKESASESKSDAYISIVSINFDASVVELFFNKGEMVAK